MGLRWKIALSMAILSLTATMAVGLISYRTTSARLLDEVDRSIGEASSQMLGRAVEGRVQIPNRGLLEVYWVRVLAADGSVAATSFPEELGVDEGATSIVGVSRAQHWSTVDVDGSQVRVYTYGLPNGAVQIGRSLDEVHSVLDDLRRRTLLLVVTVSIASAMLGWMIATTVAAPLRRLTRSAEDVGSSGRLDVDVPGVGRDEVGRLGSAFRDMLSALARSRDEQQRLVQDAGHELRTPLTSMKTNLSVLRRHPDMDADMRDRVLADLHTEVTELTDLVNELVAVASGELDEQPNGPVELAGLTVDVAERVGRRRSRDVVVHADAETWVAAPRSAIERAVTNLVDNACKFDQSGESVEVVVAAGSLTVLDRGPGVPDAEYERIFDRFHRAETARSMPGSGLGLSIVRDVVTRAGGSVGARARAGGGAAIGFTLPTIVAPGHRPDTGAQGVEVGGTVDGPPPLPPPGPPPVSG